MAALNPITIGVVVATFIALAIGVYLVRKRLSDDDSEGGSPEERLESSTQHRDDYSLPVTKRVAGMTSVAKWAVGALLVILGVVVYNVYSFYKTGTPAQMLYASETWTAIIVSVAAGIGIVYERRRARGEGKLTIVHEADPENGVEETVQTVYYDPDDVIEDDHGTVVAEYKRTRMFGLFRNPKRVADDRQLRADGDVHRPLSDKVMHRIPSHATKVGSNHYTFTTQGSKTTTSPTATADYEYRPPFNLSGSDLRRYRSNMQMMQEDLEAARTLNAQLHKQIRDLRGRLTNTETDAWKEALSIIERIAPLLNQNDHHTLQQVPKEAFNGRSSRQPQSQQDGQGARGTPQNGQYGGDGR